VLCAREAIGDAPFAVINADDYYGKSAFKVMYDYLAGNTDPSAYSMVGFQLGNTVTDHGSVARGVCVTNEAGYLTKIDERTRIEKYEGGIHYTEDGENWVDLPADTIVSMNMWGFTPSFLRESADKFRTFLATDAVARPEKAEFFLPFVVAELLGEGKARARVMTSADKWYGVTYAADKPLVVAALKQMAQEGKYPDSLWG
jgi:hypothetical protein